MGKLLWLLDADYLLEDSKGVVTLYCIDKQGKKVLVLDPGFEPYFYAMPVQGKEKQLKARIERLNLRGLAKLLRVELVEKVWEGKPVKLVKVTIDNPRKLKDVRDLVKNWPEVKDTYEYAESYYRRYLIHKRLEPAGWIEVEGSEASVDGFEVDYAMRATSVRKVELEAEPPLRVLAFDTEWVEEDGEARLIMLSLADDKGYRKVLTSHSWRGKPEYVEVVANERAIIERFLQIVHERDIDIITGFNSDGFDFPKLRERADQLKIKLMVGRNGKPLRIVRRARISTARSIGRVHVDCFNFVNNILSPTMRTEVLTLDAVAQELLGIGKEELPYKQMVEMWAKKERLSKLAAYSMWDAELTLKLAQFLLPQIFSLCRLTSELIYDVARYTYSQLVEGYLMRCAVVDNVLIPYRPKTEEIMRRRALPPFKGAIVIEPKRGIHSDILVFDFRSLYPSIIVSHNISPETFNCEHTECKRKNAVPELGYHFCIKQKGFLPKHLEKLIIERKALKAQMKKLKKGTPEWNRFDCEQRAIKTVSNAAFGYTGFFAARWYKRECGASITAWGRMYIRKIMEMAKKEGFEIIYADTDGVFVRLPSKS